MTEFEKAMARAAWDRWKINDDREARLRVAFLKGAEAARSYLLADDGDDDYYPLTYRS